MQGLKKRKPVHAILRAKFSSSRLSVLVEHRQQPIVISGFKTPRKHSDAGDENHLLRRSKLLSPLAVPLQGNDLDVPAAPVRRVPVERHPLRVAAPVEVDIVVVHELESDNVQQHLCAAATTGDA